MSASAIAVTAPNSGIPSGAIRKRPTVDELAEMIGDDELEESHAAGTIFTAPSGKVLLLLRSPSETNYGNHWSLPGGKADDNETPEEAAIREANEELGGTAPDGERKLLSQRRTPTGMTFHTFVQQVPDEFTPRLIDGEHTQHIWASPDDLPTPMHPAVAETFAALGQDTDFNESDHPRDHGKFATGHGSGEADDPPGYSSSMSGKSIDELKFLASRTMEILKSKKSGKKALKEANEVGQKVLEELRRRRNAKDEGLARDVQSAMDEANFREIDHPRDHGQFTSGGGNSGESNSVKRPLAEKIKAHVETFKKHGAATRDWIKDQQAGEVLSTIAKSPKTKEAVSFALQSLLSHATGLDQSTWKINEELIDATVNHLGTAATITALQAKDLLRRSVKGLIAVRDAAKAKIAGDAPDGITEMLRALLDVLGDEDSEDRPATDSALRLALDRDSVREFDKEGRLHVSEANICKACISPYRGAEIMEVDPSLNLDPAKIYNLLRPPEELERATATSNGIQILRQHIAVNADDHRPWDVAGSVGTSAQWIYPYVKNALTIWPASDIDGIKLKTKTELSPGYAYRPIMESGTFEGQHYDGKMVDIRFNHVAIVVDGRQGKDVVVGDSADKVLEDSRWSAIENAILLMSSELRLP